MTDTGPAAALDGLYREHVARLRTAYDEVMVSGGLAPDAALEVASDVTTHRPDALAHTAAARPWDVIAIHSGSLLRRSEFDDQFWPLRPTPHWQHWLMLNEP